MGKAYSLDLRKKVILFLLKNKREASKIFGIGEDTIYRWLRRHRSNDLAPKNRTDFLRKVSLDVLRVHVEKHQDHTLKEIGQTLGLSASNVLYGLRKLNITRKKTTLYAERCPEKRAIFQKTIESIDPRTLIYIDEAGVDNRLFRTHARALRGQKIYADIPGKKKRAIQHDRWVDEW